MSLRIRAMTLAILGLAVCLPSATLAANPQLKLPAFDHLQQVAKESVNVTIGPLPLSIAKWALKHDDDADDAAARELLKGIRTIYVRSYEFAEDNQYSEADIDAVRKQLSEPGWNAVAQVRQRGRETENVDVYVSMDHEQVNGLVVVASSPRKFTIVNVVGLIDPKNFAKIQDRFGLPALVL